MHLIDSTAMRSPKISSRKGAQLKVFQRCWLIPLDSVSRGVSPPQPGGDHFIPPLVTCYTLPTGSPISLVKVMQNVITIADRHGLLIVFLNVLLSQGGLPLPAVPTVMTVAALARQNPYQIAQIILAGISGALIAEFALYWCGWNYGQRFLGLLCRLSFSPDFCVRRTEEVFARVGSWSLLFSKFILIHFNTHKVRRAKSLIL
jgi:hypothetical protein